jgi:hypothetical protein
MHSLPVALSSLIRFGTSTWTYEGWQGQVYKREYKKTLFARELILDNPASHVEKPDPKNERDRIASAQEWSALQKTSAAHLLRF